MDDNELNYKVKNCLKCHAETNSNDNQEFFCSQCGAPIINKCSNYECQKILKETDKYCKYCGSPSIFNNYGLFDSPNFFNNTDDLPF